MTLLLVLAAMTAAATLAVIWPLFRTTRHARSGSDVEVYRDQLEEVERDRAAGLIAETEAQAARVEISRRLLAAVDTMDTASQAVDAISAAPRRRRLAVASMLTVPLVAGGLYFWLGSPELAFSTQLRAQNNGGAAEQSVESLVAQVEAHLQHDPNDGRGWEILAPVYMHLGRYTDSVTAWRNALQRLGENAPRDANLGEALTAEANGVVTADAKAAFVRAAALDQTNVTAQYYLGLAAEQDGQREQAAKIWRDLIARAPAGAFWAGQVREALARAEGKSTEPRGPSAAAMTAAEAAPPAQQAAMIQGMVDRLAARLKQDGSDAEGWVRLIRSYRVLGEGEKAEAAIGDARQALAGDPSKLGQLNAAIKELDTGVMATPVPATPRAEGTTAGVNEQAPNAQGTMIEDMVSRLAARLKQDGSDVDGWAKLVRSYKVLGETEKADAAVTDARQALGSDPSKLQQFEAALTQIKAGNVAVRGATTGPTPAGPATPIPPEHLQGATMQDMVERLADRLKKSGVDVEGWLTLVRSYATLGEKDKAVAAIGSARQALANDPGKLEQFNQALKSANIDD